MQTIIDCFLYIFSGLTALAKVLISMEEKRIPANLHYNTPNPEIPGLHDGRLKVVTENTPWKGGYVGINSFGFGGANVHAIIKSHSDDDVKNGSIVETERQMRLFTFAARTRKVLFFFYFLDHFKH